MTYPLTLTALFQSIGLSYGPMLPVVALMLFALLALPALFRQGANAESVGYAVYCNLAQMLGILLMSSGALPALYAVFAQQPLAEVTYLGLLLVFALGGLIFLWNDAKLRTIDPLARAIPSTLFFVTWKFIGLLTVTFGGISLVLQSIMAADRTDGWWVKDLVMLLYGLILCWFTMHRPTPTLVAPAKQPVNPVRMAPTPKPVVVKQTVVVPVKKSLPVKGNVVKPAKKR